MISQDALRQSGGPLGRVRAAQAAVGVEAVVKGLAVDTEDVGLQVALLGGAVGAVPALEWLPSLERERRQKEKTENKLNRVAELKPRPS